MNYPKYVKTADGYIGVLVSVDDLGPSYHCPGGERYADRWEIEHGSDNRADLEEEAQEKGSIP